MNYAAQYEMLKSTHIMLEQRASNITRDIDSLNKRKLFISEMIQYRYLVNIVLNNINTLIDDVINKEKKNIDIIENATSPGKSR